MDAFSALADPVRRGLLRDLSDRSARVVDLAAGRPISRPAVSKHLRVLTDAGLVDADELGRERHYRLRPAGLEPVLHLLADLVPEVHGPPVTPAMLDALDLEVRRVGRDRREERGTPTTSPRRQPGEPA